MKIGLIDVDGHNCPNIPLMKLSAYHKSLGDNVEFYDMFSGHCDVVYKSKVFSFTPDYAWAIDADNIIAGGTGYQIYNDSGTEKFCGNDIVLPPEIENIYPDYSLYPQYCSNRAYGFLTRGCPRDCGFCIVSKKEGLFTHTVSDLSDFWNGQKYIEIMDSNLLAGDYGETVRLLKTLINSNAFMRFGQGLDIRYMNRDYAELLNRMKIDNINFAWDYPKDEEVPVMLERFRKWYNRSTRDICVYILSNYNSTIEEDLYRIYKVRDAGYSPYLMIYEKYNLPRNSKLGKMQQWCNNRIIFKSCPNFKDFRG